MWSAQDPVFWFTAVSALLLASAAVVLARLVAPVVFVSAGVVLSVFSGHWGEFGLPLGPDRVLLAVGILAAAIRIVSRRSSTDMPLPAGRLLLLTATAGYAVASAVWFGSLDRREDVFALLDKLGLIPFVIFLLGPVIFDTEKHRRILLGSLVALGAYLGTVAMLETVGLRSLILPRYIADQSIGIHFGRVRGPFVESVGAGLALYICLVAAVLWGASTRWRHGRAVAAPVALACLVGIVGTVTRNAWLAAVTATVVTLVVVPAMRRWLVPVLAGGTAVVTASLLLVPGLLDRASSRASSNRPLWDRLNSDRAAWNMFLDRPAFGHGWGSFREISSSYYQVVPDYPLTFVNQVHNVLLSHAAELGVVGAGLWLTSVFVALSPAFRPAPLNPNNLWRAGLIAIGTAWCVTAMFAPLGYAFPNALLWTWAGMVWACRDEALAEARRPLIPPLAPLPPAPSVTAPRPAEPVTA